jgi:2-oxoglutarate ferredoxin oxidoreductase subunit beta
VFLYNYFELDAAEAAHGRAPAMATGLKRVQPDKIVFSYQGDGDLAAIGLAEIMWAATRGENITVFFVNNAIYGMTGGQMAPTSLPGQVTRSSPLGRDIEMTGMPIRTAELLAGLPGATYVVRRSVHNIHSIKEAKKAIRQAFRVQMAEAGFSLIEFLSSCPTNWGLSPCQSLQWIDQVMLPYYPLGDYKVADIVKHLN